MTHNHPLPNTHPTRKRVLILILYPLTIADKTRKDPKTLKRRQDAIEALQKKGYCPVCAENLLQFVGDVLRKEE